MWVTSTAQQARQHVNKIFEAAQIAFIAAVTCVIALSVMMSAFLWRLLIA